MDRVLVVEDQPVIREWLISLARQVFPEAVYLEAATLQQALPQCHPMPDLVLTDLSLPDGIGHELISHIKSESEATPCIVVTSFEDDDFLFPSLKAGADGYLLKDQEDDELIELLKGILNNKPPLSPVIAHRLFEHFREPKNVVSESELTAREMETLQLISRGYTVKQCAKSLEISHHTVSGYIKEIYRKLQINSRAEAAREAARLGIQ